MDCKRCSEIPSLAYDSNHICIVVPTIHHIEPIALLLESRGLRFEREEEVFTLFFTDLKLLISTLDALNLSSIEKSDIKIMPLAKGPAISVADLKQFRSLKYWSDIYSSDDLLYVLKNNSLKIMFHPIVDAKSKKIYGYEALSRGVREDGSIIPPNRLFEMARATDLLFFLDRLCRETIIKRASELGINKKLFINFIPTSIYDPEKCLRSTDNAIYRYKLDPRQVVFEVVETEYIEDYDHLSYILNYYRDKGYSTALDDIGSGYSTIEGLLALKSDYMKIDLDLIRGIESSAENRAIVSNYIDTAKSNGIYSLAEGVETANEYKCLLDLGVDFIQGYYFGRPSEVPAQKIDME